MRNLSAIGNNINQLAAKAHTLGFIDVPMLKTKPSAGISFKRMWSGSFYAPKRAE